MVMSEWRTMMIINHTIRQWCFIQDMACAIQNMQIMKRRGRDAFMNGLFPHLQTIERCVGHQQSTLALCYWKILFRVETESHENAWFI